MEGRRVIYAELTLEEYATVKRLCKRDRLTVSNFVRRAINGVLLEEGDESLEFLQERLRGGIRSAAAR